ncbi:MAG: flagellar hook-associated protein FlgK [Aquabacterium sp.]
MSTIQNALSGTLAAQAALHTASQNIANVMTPGYTRQGVLMKANAPLQGGAMAAGAGVQAPSLLRFSESYKSQQMWQAASELGQRSTTQPYLTQLEQVMGADEASINSGLDAFFAALNAASVEPNSSPLRQQVVTAAGALAERFNSLNQVLSYQRLSVYQQRSATVAQVNGLSTDIAVLNKKIAATQASGVNASGLIDERDQKIDALASLVAVRVVDQADGSRSISLRDGQPLVVSGIASTVTIQGNPDGSQTLKLSFASESFELQSNRLGGQLGGLDDFEYSVLRPLQTDMSDLAGGLATRFNTLLTSGYAMDGSAGQPLFVFDPASATAMLKVTPGLQGQQLGFSSDPAQPGNSDRLLQVIDLKDQPLPVTSLGNVLLGDAYTQLTGRLATDSRQNQASLSTAQTVRTQAETSWKSTSGVNTDEEAVNLMQYQQMYQANMKVIAVANELFDSTLQML